MLSEFFNRSLGNWVSHRSYYYVKKDELINSTTEFNWTKKDSSYSIEWNPDNKFTLYSVNWDNEVQNSQGSILCYFEDDGVVIFRDSGYFTGNATQSKVLICTQNILKTITEYNNMRFVETIEFLTDILRVRRTIAYSLRDDSIFLIGNYIEHKQGD